MRGGRLSEAVVAHPRAIVVAWLLVAGVSAVAAIGLFGQLTNRGYEVPGSDSVRTADILLRKLPDRGGTELFVLLTVRRPRAAELQNGGVERIVRRAILPHRDVLSIDAVGAGSSEDFMVAIVASVRLGIEPIQAEREVPELRAKLARATTPRLRMELLGWPAFSERYSELARRDLARAELIAFPVSLAILLVAFLSVIAATLPVLLAAVTSVVTFALLFLISQGTGLSVFVTNTASVLALGLSIDYSLFMVTRMREEMRHTTVEEAVRRTLATTGRAVVISGLALASSLLSLFAVGVGLFSSMAIGATLGALVAALVAVTLVPAIVCLLGHRLDALTLRPAARAASRATVWHALGRVVVGHPVVALSCSLAIMIALAIPTFSLQLGLNTLTALPPTDVARQATDRMERMLGAGASGPVDIVTQDEPEALARILQRDSSVGSLAGPFSGRDGWQALQTTLDVSPDSAAARRVVERMRRRLAARERRTYVGGPTAVGVDLLDRIEARTPYVVLLTMVTAAVALAIGLRSIVIPIKAVLGTLLSVAATVGIVLRLFPDSAGMESMEFFVPLFLFVVVFGLSIDYEVFLLSRIAEAVRSGSSNREAVVIGLVRSGRSMTLAGLTLAAVFLAFSTSSLASFRQLGAGVAIAIVLDVTLVRCVVIPASVVLLGRWNWWFPAGATRR